MKTKKNRSGANRSPLRSGSYKNNGTNGHEAEVRLNLPPLNGVHHHPPSSTTTILNHWAGREGELQTRLAQFVTLLLETNRLFNLTGDRTPELQWTRHINDALMTARIIEEKVGRPAAGSRILDLGSGGGVPGMIWAILWSEASVDMVDSVQKKCAFLSHAAEQLGLENVGVLNDRAEKLGQDDQYREQYDWASARAVAPMNVLAELLVPFVKVGGFSIAIKGEEITEELKNSRRAFRMVGAAGPACIVPYFRYAGGGGNVVITCKASRTPSTYPRREGTVEKSPL